MLWLTMLCSLPACLTPSRPSCTRQIGQLREKCEVCENSSRCPNRPQPNQGRFTTHLQEEVCCVQVRQLHCSHVGVSAAHGTQQRLAVAGLHIPGRQKGEGRQQQQRQRDKCRRDQ